MNLSNLEYRSASAVIATLIESGAKTATTYISEKLTIRASRKTYKGKLPPKNSKSIEVVLTIGAPNFEAREFIKMCKKAGESFPIKKIQLKYVPEKRHG
jgi:hypothetical protein